MKFKKLFIAAFLLAIFTAVSLLVIGCSSQTAGTGAARDGDNPAAGIITNPYAKGELLVKFKNAKPNAVLQNVSELSARQGIGLSVIKSFKYCGVNLLRIDSGLEVSKAIDVLRADPSVEYVEPNYLLHSYDLTPNDPSLNEQWNFINTGQTGGTADCDIDAEVAWSLTTGNSQFVAGVIDTGVDYNHEDLHANMWKNTLEDWDSDGNPTNDGVDNDGNGYVDDYYGMNAINGSGDPMDDNHHGTHCAGILGAATNNSKGVAGVCWNAKIMALKFLDSTGSGYTSDAITCIEYAIDHKVSVLSNSWGGGGYSQSLYNAIKVAGDNNILFVVASGNESRNNDTTPAYPASYDLPNIISVGASDDKDNRSSYSNYGQYSVDVFAPGEKIYSTFPSNSYSFLSGTSMACPHVSGLALLLLADDPSLTHYQLKAKIMRSVEVKSTFTGKALSNGRINAADALMTNNLPYIFSTNSTTAAVGNTVIFQGVNFGATRGTSTVTLGGGVSPTTYVSWSDTEISFKIPAGAQDGNVIVTTDAGVSNAFPIKIVANKYSVSDSADYKWVDTSKGKVATITGDDSSQEISIGFNFPYFGQAKTKVCISSNGYLTFGSSGNAWQNVAIPNNAQPNDLIAVYWDDLDPSKGGSIRYLLSGSEPNRELTVEWNGVPHVNSSDGGTFQAILYENTGIIKFQYKDTNFGNVQYNDGASATIGVENSDGSYGNLYSYNSTIGTTHRISDGKAIVFDYNTRPVKPDGLNAESLSSGSVKLTWNDKSTDESGFSIERKKEDGDYEAVGTVAANIKEYTDTGLLPGTTYTYVVKSYKGLYHSDPSNEASVETDGTPPPSPTPTPTLLPTPEPT